MFSKTKFTKAKVTSALLASGVLIGVLAAASPAGATTSATVTIGAGSLAFVGTPAAPAFGTVNLTGVDQTLTANTTWEVGDATGSGNGWNVQVTAGTLTSGSNTIPDSSFQVTGVTPTCAGGATCTLATLDTSKIASYPLAVQSGGAEVYSANLSTGMGDQNLAFAWSLAVPANTFAGTYSGTWTISLVSAP